MVGKASYCGHNGLGAGAGRDTHSSFQILFQALWCSGKHVVPGIELGLNICRTSYNHCAVPNPVTLDIVFKSFSNR